MSQKIAKLWGLSALATKLLFRQIYRHHQPFTSVDGFLKRLTKNGNLRWNSLVTWVQRAKQKKMIKKTVL